MSTVRRPDPSRVVALFEALADLAPAEADEQLAKECGSDSALHDEVHALLIQDRAAAPGFLAPQPALLAEALRGWDPERNGPSQILAEDGPIPGSSRLGRYYVLHKLAEGGMGVIYVGYDESLDRRVALKVLHRGAAVREWLLREGQALGRLAHPNVVSVHEISEQDGRVFLAMELIEGPTLRAWLDESPRPFADTLRLFLQAGRGLAAAHRAGLVHRDFKPDNVLIGKDGRARVVDFGIVSLAQSAPEEEPEALPPEANALSSPLTQTGVLLGTPAFMSPEQFRGERATPHSDQFSFCVALYRAAYGTSPFPASEVAELARSIQNEPPAPPPRRPEVPAWLAPILLRGLARDPSLRFQSMDELLLMIERNLPRDPELDPTRVVRERRLLGGLLITGYLISSVPMLTPAGADLLMRPAGLVTVPAILVAMIFSLIAWKRRGFASNRYGRLIASLFSVGLVALLAHRVLALRLGQSAQQILVEDMVLFSAIWALAGLTFERWLLWLALFMGIPAIVGAFVPQRIPLLFGGLGLACIAGMAVRLFIDRHLSPEAIVVPSSAPADEQ